MICTGYTSLIAQGEITTAKDFLKVCLRAFGVLAEMRDEPLSVNIPTQIEKNDFYSKKKEQAEKKLKELKAFFPKQWEEMLKKEIKATKETLKKGEEKAEKERMLLDRLTREICGWQCDKEFRAVKNFALEQLGRTREETFLEVWQKLNTLENFTWETFKKQKIEELEKETAYYEKKEQKEKKRQKEKQDFLDKFFLNLKKLEE